MAYCTYNYVIIVIINLLEYPIPADAAGDISETKRAAGDTLVAKRQDLAYLGNSSVLRPSVTKNPDADILATKRATGDPLV